MISAVQAAEREILDRKGRWHSLRVYPYRTSDNRIDGAVMVLLDIHEAKTAGLRLQEALDYSQAIIETVRDPLLVLDAGLRVRSANRAFYETFGGKPEDTENQSLYDLGNRDWDIPALRRLLEEILPRETALENFEVTHAFAAAGPRIMLLNARRLRREGEGAELILLAIEDVTERRQAEERLSQAHDELELRVRERTSELLTAHASLQDQVVQRRELLLRLGTAEEEQRHRIARELHDQMGQHIAALLLGFKSLEGNPAQPGLYRQLQELTNQIGKEVHRIAMELRPTALNDLGLHTALRNYVEEWSERSGIRIDLRSPGDGTSRLPPQVETTVYRIVQEALTNVFRHAQATQVSVIVERRSDHLLAIVEDNGTGFAVEGDTDPGRVPGRLGLAGMRERAALAGGTLEIESSPGKGTTVFARIPLSEGEGAARD